MRPRGTLYIPWMSKIRNKNTREHKKKNYVVFRFSLKKKKYYADNDTRFIICFADQYHHQTHEQPKRCETINCHDVNCTNVKIVKRIIRNYSDSFTVKIDEIK